MALFPRGLFESRSEVDLPVVALADHHAVSQFGRHRSNGLQRGGVLEPLPLVCLPPVRQLTSDHLPRRHAQLIQRTGETLDPTGQLGVRDHPWRAIGSARHDLRRPRRLIPPRRRSLIRPGSRQTPTARECCTAAPAGRIATSTGIMKFLNIGAPQSNIWRSLRRVIAQMSP
jgi:hypothetical protein